MKITKPKKLVKGDLIGVISPASSTDDIIKVEEGVRYLENNGYKVEVGKNVGKYHGYLAGEDSLRLNDLHYMFNKKEVKAIICVRGGYGSPRLIDKIDYKIIRNNPKIFVGYSDITALNMAFYHKAGLITFIGPMVSVDFGGEVSRFSEENFWRILTSSKKIGRLSLPREEKIFQLSKGNVTGRIIGGNLALLVSLLGTDYFPEIKDRILFLEDIGELPFRIDRMLNQLRLAGIFNQIKGIVLGAFIDCNETDPLKKTLSLGEVVDDYLSKLKIPVIYNFPNGHIKDIITIPNGIKIKMNASRGFIEYLEGAVT
jgi:muramoyltetrapeptide carboxypeptidase